MTPFNLQRTDDVRRLRKPEARAALPVSAMRGSDWAKEGALPHQFRMHKLAAVEWYIECQTRGIAQLVGVVEVDPARRNGIPVLCGTRFTIAQLLAELAETTGVNVVAEEFDLNSNAIREVLNGLSLMLQRPCFEE